MSEQITTGPRLLPQEDAEINKTDAGLTPAAHHFERFEGVVKGSRSTLSPEEKAARARKRKLWRVFRAAIIPKSEPPDPLVLSRCLAQFDQAWKRGGEKYLGDRYGDEIIHVKNYAWQVARTERKKSHLERMTDEDRAKARQDQRERRRLARKWERERKDHAENLFLALGSGELKLQDLDIEALLDLEHVIEKAHIKWRNGLRREMMGQGLASRITLIRSLHKPDLSSTNLDGVN